MESGAPGLPEPMTCPEVQQTLLPVPRTVGGPCLPGPSCPPAWVQLPPARRALEAWVKGLGQSVGASPFLLCCSKACSRGLPWSFRRSLCNSLSPSRSLPLFPAEVGCPAVPSPLHSRAFPQEAESKGPPRSGCHDISVGGGLCCPGLSAERWPPSGGQGTGVSFSCGTRAGTPSPASSASCHLK